VYFFVKFDGVAEFVWLHLPIDLHVESDGCVHSCICVNVAVSLFDILLQSTLKQDTKISEYPTLAALKVIFDWLRSEPDLLSDPAFNSFV